MNSILIVTLAMTVALLVDANALAKDAPTFYTPQRVEAARHNVEQYDWAKKLFERVRAGDGNATYYIGPEYGPADALAKKDDEFVWMLMPSTSIPRHIRENDKARCPTHGDALRRLDPHCGFSIDPLNHPYKVKCKVGGELWPSNDFAAGDMTSGDFPDDGNGVTRNGVFYPFLRHYAHMSYGGFVVPSLRSLSQAYVITGDKTYARKGVILLAKLATEYPNYTDRSDRLFYAIYPDQRDPDHSWKNGGMITDLIWETFCTEAIAYAYDGLYDYMDDDPELIEFLRTKGMPVQSGAELRTYIENHILRPAIDALQRGLIHGNPGHHQATAAAIALVLDDYRETKDNPFNSAAMVDYVMHYQHPSFANIGHSADILINGIDRSGGGDESPNYASIKLDFIRTARLLEQIRARNPKRFPDDKYPALFGGPKAQKQFDFFLNVTIHGYFLPSIGDCGGIHPPARVEPQSWSYLPAKHFLFAFNEYADPRYATAALDIKTGQPAPGELFEPYSIEKIKSAADKPEAKIPWTTRLIDGYGTAILDNSASAENRRAVMLNYTNLLGHQQCDHLMVQLFTRGVEMLPDLGYPADWKYRYQFDANSLAHNTVTVDETQPRLGHFGGRALLFGAANGLHVVSAMHDPYPAGQLPGGESAKQTSLYQRTLAMVDVDEKRYYVIDHFAVNGGTQHDQSWHGMLVPADAPQLDWTSRAGTMAGENVALYGKWKDRWNRDRDDFPAFLTDVRTATLAEPAAWTWNSGLPEGDALRMHLIPVGGDMQVITASASAPNRPADWKLDYIFARRNVADGAPSQFVTVLDGYQNEPVVQSVKLISENPVVLEITHAGGTDRVTIDVPLEPNRFRHPQRTSVSISSKRGEMSFGKRYAQSRISAVDYDNDRIALVASDDAARDFAPGGTIRIYNDGRTAMYPIKAAERERDLLWLTLDETAVFARGRVRDVSDGVVHIDSYLTYAGGAPPPANFFAGAWLGQGRDALRIDGASRGEGFSLIHLEQPAPAAALRRRFPPGSTITVWQYAPGDAIESAPPVIDAGVNP